MPRTSLHQRFVLVATFLALAGWTFVIALHTCADPDKLSPLAMAYPDLATAIEKDLPIAPGMTVEALQQMAARFTADAERRDATDVNVTVDRNYAFIPSTPQRNSNLGPADADSNYGAITYWINGNVQCWLDIAIKDGHVQNIYVVPGNLTVNLPPVLWRGTGSHRGMFAKRP